MTRPTDTALEQFKMAQQLARWGIHDTKDPAVEGAMFGALLHMAEGMGAVAVGLRATYMLLEDVNRKLDRQATGPR